MDAISEHEIFRTGDGYRRISLACVHLGDREVGCTHLLF